LRADLSGQDGSSSSSEEDAKKRNIPTSLVIDGEKSKPRGERVAKAVKRRKLQTAAAGGKPSGEYTLCRQHFILILLCIYSIIINIF
jgi:hypothetical protein